MIAFLADWLNLLIRWAHIIVGIAWIGASFHFVWLDFSLRRRERMNGGVAGTSWMVHGGGFYHVEKYQVAPASLPSDLHWFKWEAYLTWMTGFLLLIVQYYWRAETYLIDPAVWNIGKGAAIGLSLLTLIAGWVIYDRLCRAIGNRTGLLATCVFLLIVGAAYLFAQMFSGRGAMIHVGALIGTIMAANVMMVIIPNQRIMVGQLLRGEAPEARLGLIGKQRSLHNNYLTLPVIVTMVANHYGFLTGHPHAWLAVALIFIVGAMVRHLINRGDAGEPFERHAWALPVAALALTLAIFATAPREAASVASNSNTVSDARALTIAATRCVTCHAAHPSHADITQPPKGVRLDSIDAMRAQAAAIQRQAVQSKAMPPGNQTGITDEERVELGQWIAGLP